MIYGQECNSCSKFYYSFSNQSDSLDVNSKTSHVFVLMKKKDSTLFTDIQNKKADSLEAVIWADYKRTKSGTISYKGVPNAKYKYYISKDLSKPTNDIKVYDKIGTGNFMYEDDTKLQWELVNEKKQIAGFFAKKRKLLLLVESLLLGLQLKSLLVMVLINSEDCLDLLLNCMMIKNILCFH